MSQATLGSAHRNSKLFSGYYLEERVDELDAWGYIAASNDRISNLVTTRQNDT
jgi:hypothetical protein